MRYTVKMHVPGRIRVHMDGGALDRRDMLRLECQLRCIEGVRRVTTYPRIGDIAVSYNAGDGEARLRAIERQIERYEPAHPVRAPRSQPAGSAVDDLLLRAAADAVASAVIPAPIRIVGKVLDAGRSARARA